MKLAAAPVLLFSLLASPAFAGIFDNAADEYQEAQKELTCCYVKLATNKQAQAELFACLKRLFPQKEILDVNEQCASEVYGSYCRNNLALKEAECIKDGFSQKQCDAAAEAGKILASQECHAEWDDDD